VDALDLARWQFGIVTVYHFFFVPVTIGLSAIVAGYETAWVRTRNPQWLRLTKFFGKLFLINFAIGVATGIVQEFQFGMNWSSYSRFVGDIFGAPLAIEGLLAFFIESTFLGLWIFGWERLSPRLHNACIWLVHIGTLFSAYFILAANSWMQHPVGYKFNPTTGRAELTDFLAVLLNKVQLVTFPHVVLAAYMTGGAFVAGIAFWRYARGDGEVRETFRRAVRTGAAVMLIGGLGVAVTGDISGKIMTEVQPMKMAAAEGLYDTATSAPFSVLTIGSLNGEHHRAIIEIPGLLSFLGTGSFNGEIQGINDLRAEYKATYGTDPGAAYYSPGDYTPVIPVTYWSFRFMIGVGLLAAAIGLVLLLASRKGRAPTPHTWLVRGAIVLPFLPIAANAFGWLFTEMGRQPWAVFGVMTTANGVSPTVSAGYVASSMSAYILIYAVLIVIEVRLMLSAVKADLPPDPRPVGDDSDDSDRPLAFAY